MREWSCSTRTNKVLFKNMQESLYRVTAFWGKKSLISPHNDRSLCCKHLHNGFIRQNRQQSKTNILPIPDTYLSCVTSSKYESITAEHLKQYTKHLLIFCAQNTILHDHICISSKVFTELLQKFCLNLLCFTAETSWTYLWEGQILHPTLGRIQMLSINCFGQSRDYLRLPPGQSKILTWRILIATSQILCCDSGYELSLPLIVHAQINREFPENCDFSDLHINKSVSYVEVTLVQGWI